MVRRWRSVSGTGATVVPGTLSLEHRKRGRKIEHPALQVHRDAVVRQNRQNLGAHKDCSAPVTRSARRVPPKPCAGHSVAFALPL